MLLKHLQIYITNYNDMIYITQEYDDSLERSHINNVYVLDDEDANLKYKEFLLDKSKNKFKIVINEHWFNIMDYQLFHKELTKEKYNLVEKKWDKFLLKHNFDYFISKILKAEKLEYKLIEVIT